MHNIHTCTIYKFISITIMGGVVAKGRWAGQGRLIMVQKKTGEWL